MAEFNALCRESVQRYVGDFERLTERIGFWIDMSDAYWTMSTEYIESVWWSLKRLHQRGLLVEDHKVTAYCPRCGTALSDAEVAQGYEQVEDPSTFVRFPIVASADPELEGAALAVWTTTPWTLPANTGVAVLAHARYAEVEKDGERLVIAEGLVARVLGEDWRTVRVFDGHTLVGARYEPPYPNVEGAHTVVVADFVSMDDGTGIVHIAPAFGTEDLAIGRAQGWPLWRPVGDDGTFDEQAPAFVRGLFVKDADPLILEDLREPRDPHQGRGLRARVPLLLAMPHPAPLLRALRVVRPHDRREGPAARGERRRALVSRPHPARALRRLAREQRGLGAVARALLGDAAADLALRAGPRDGDRFPLRAVVARRPGHCPSSTRTSRSSTRSAFACPSCGEAATRVPEVIDAWYDSGAMPFAQWGYHPELGRGSRNSNAPSPPTSSPRRSTRPAAGSTR